MKARNATQPSEPQLRHNEGPNRALPLVSNGATVVGSGVLAKAEGANIVFC